MTNNLRALRLSAGVSVRTLERESGIDRGTIYALERQRARPRLDTARALARALGCDVDDLWPDGRTE